jgi:hypothetical protein
MYEADDLSVVTSPEYLTRLNAPTPATISTLKYFQNTSRAVCRVVCSLGSSTGGHMLAMRLTVPGAESEPMCRFLSDEAFPQVMDLTGAVACHLYAADHSASHVNTTESGTREFDVPAWVLLCEATTRGAAEKAKELIDGPEFRRLSVVVRRDAAVYALEVCRLSVPAQD